MLETLPDRLETAGARELAHAAASRCARGLIAAFVVGLMAIASPIAALLALAVLGALALMQTETGSFDPLTLAGPALAALLVFFCAGEAAAIGVLFVWRLQADASWSVREANRLALIQGRVSETTPRARMHMWLTPLYGLSLVAYTSPHMIAGLPLDLPHVPLWVPMAAAGLALVGFADWVLRAAADWRLGELAGAPTAQVGAHHLFFLLAYGVTGEVSSGLAAMIAWRLAQAVRLGQAQASFTAVP